MATVADTAFLVAAFRAQESSRADALFIDPLAERLAGEVGRAMLEKVRSLGDMAGWSTVVRTVLIDRLIREALARGVGAIVNLGAGLDTRPYRMEVPPSLEWIEIDQASVITHKNQVLANERPRCRLERVSMDLLDGEATREVFSRLSGRLTRALVLAEGVFPYLSEDEVGRILDELGDHQAFEGLIVDYISPEIMRARNAVAGSARALSSVPMRFAPEDWKGFFASHGWKVRELSDLAEEGRRCNRPFQVPEAMRAAAQSGRAVGMFAAYALMARAPR